MAAPAHIGYGYGRDDAGAAVGMTPTLAQHPHWREMQGAAADGRAGNPLHSNFQIAPPLPIADQMAGLTTEHPTGIVARKIDAMTKLGAISTNVFMEAEGEDWIGDIMPIERNDGSITPAKMVRYQKMQVRAVQFVPEEGVSATLEYTEVMQEFLSTRKGISCKLELDALETTEGFEKFQLTIAAMAASIRLDLNYHAVGALLQSQDANIHALRMISIGTNGIGVSFADELIRQTRLAFPLNKNRRFLLSWMGITKELFRTVAERPMQRFLLPTEARTRYNEPMATDPYGKYDDGGRFGVAEGRADPDNNFMSNSSLRGIRASFLNTKTAAFDNGFHNALHNHNVHGGFTTTRLKASNLTDQRYYDSYTTSTRDVRMYDLTSDREVTVPFAKIVALTHVGFENGVLVVNPVSGEKVDGGVTWQMIFNAWGRLHNISADIAMRLWQEHVELRMGNILGGVTAEDGTRIVAEDEDVARNMQRRPVRHRYAGRALARNAARAARGGGAASSRFHGHSFDINNADAAIKAIGAGAAHTFIISAPAAAVGRGNAAAVSGGSAALKSAIATTHDDHPVRRALEEVRGEGGSAAVKRFLQSAEKTVQRDFEGDPGQFLNATAGGSSENVFDLVQKGGARKARVLGEEDSEDEESEDEDSDDEKGAARRGGALPAGTLVTVGGAEHINDNHNGHVFFGAKGETNETPTTLFTGNAVKAIAEGGFDHAGLVPVGGTNGQKLILHVEDLTGDAAATKTAGGKDFARKFQYKEDVEGETNAADSDTHKQVVGTTSISIIGQDGNGVVTLKKLNMIASANVVIPFNYLLVRQSITLLAAMSIATVPGIGGIIKLEERFLLNVNAGNHTADGSAVYTMMPYVKNALGVLATYNAGVIDYIGGCNTEFYTKAQLDDLVDINNWLPSMGAFDRQSPSIISIPHGDFRDGDPPCAMDLSGYFPGESYPSNEGQGHYSTCRYFMEKYHPTQMTGAIDAQGRVIDHGIFVGRTEDYANSILHRSFQCTKVFDDGVWHFERILDHGPLGPGVRGANVRSSFMGPGGGTSVLPSHDDERMREIERSLDGVWRD